LLSYHNLLSAGARSLLVFGFNFRLFTSGTHGILVVSSDEYIYHLYCMSLLRIQPSLLGITTCSLVTILIMLTQLPLLASSWVVFPGSYVAKGFPRNCIYFNTILLPCLVLLISNLRNLPVCASGL